MSDRQMDFLRSQKNKETGGVLQAFVTGHNCCRFHEHQLEVCWLLVSEQPRGALMVFILQNTRAQLLAAQCHEADVTRCQGAR